MTASSRFTAPQTLNGIKRQAKNLARAENVPHTFALNEISKVAGFENYAHAQRTLHSEDSVTFPVYLTVYWRSKKWSKDQATSGRETLRLDLSRPLAQIVPKHKLLKAYNLQRFKIDAPDHLFCLDDSPTVDLAREKLIAAAQIILFMATTNLIPCTTEAHRATYRVAETLPGRDHLKIWWHPSFESWVCMDEPYEHSAVDSLKPDREQWCTNNGYQFVYAMWPGIHNIGFAKPYLFTENIDLARHLERVLPALTSHPLLQQEVKWSGESGAYLSLFTSPAAVKAGVTPKTRPQPWPKGYILRGNIACNFQSIGDPTRWRPAECMALKSHKDCARLLRTISGSLPYGRRSHTAVTRVISELNTWINEEHKATVTDFNELDCYYTGREPVPQISADKIPSYLNHAIGILSKEYAMCSSRDKLIARLEKLVNQRK